MYKVSSNLTSAYGSDLDGAKKSGGPEMPHVTSGSHRMTNVHLSNGDIVQGIRRNASERGSSNLPDLSAPASLKPLRYTAGLVCDPHLESLRPERESKHAPFQGGETWKKNLVPHPQTYEGSFVDADMQQFRPCPRQPTANDPWYTSRVPEPQYFPANERLGGSQFLQPQPNEMLNPYEQIYPQDELSKIKMRNRRFQQSCAQEMINPSMAAMQTGYGPGAPMMMMVPPPQQPMMMRQPQQQMMPMMPMQQQPVFSPNVAADLDELAVLDQELNMTRRATRPFVPSGGETYGDLQRSRQLMEEPLEVQMPRRVNPPTSIDQLPAPKALQARKLQACEETLAAAKPRQEVRIADQIAIRSLVLGKSLNKMGREKPESPKRAPAKESPI